MSELELLKRLGEARGRIEAQVGTRIVGQSSTVHALLCAIFARGHALLVGAPGLAKTLLVKTLAEALGWSFKRIQFTPDLLPSDVTGTEILRENRDTGERTLAYVPGPVFANLVLADEINRTPPKTQAALLEAMQERCVTVGGQTRALPSPFFVLATQNPIEQEGTYQLPEAQLDRFLLAVELDYPSVEEERAIATLDLRERPAVEVVLGPEEHDRLAELVGRLPVPPVALDFAVALARASRPQGKGLPFVKENVAWGAGPRATQHLVAAARAHAALTGREAVDVAAIRAVAPWVLAHRIVTSFQGAGAGVRGRHVVEKLLATVAP